MGAVAKPNGGTTPSRFERIAVIHNYYQQPGGEDGVFASEVDLLTARGHEVQTYTLHNDAITGARPVSLARNTLWNRTTYDDLGARLRAQRPTIAHFHNTFPLISPAAYYAARAAGAAVVQTLHNFRLCCPNALFYRDGRVCEDCLGRSVAWPGVVHACYHDSRSATGVIAAMLAVHRAAGTWRKRVDAYVALSRFARSKFIEGGLPAERVHVKPNFLALDPGLGPHDGGYALFVGRLSGEKGLVTLLRSWSQVGNGRVLKIVGSGPLEHIAAEGQPGVEWLGWLSREQVLDLMRHAAVLILPSECYENFPLTLVEAYATGLPVIGSSGGSIAELVEDFGTGRLFRPGDVGELAEALRWALTNVEELRVCGAGARAEFLRKYTASENYVRLLQVYEHAVAAGG